MALLFMDSFNHYATADLTTKWSTMTNASGTPTVNATGGRRSSGSFRVTNGFSTQFSVALYKVLTPDATGICGVAVNMPTSYVGTGGFQLASFRESGAAQVSLRLNADFTLSVVRGSHSGTVLGTTVATLSAGAFAYVEWRVLIHPSAGTVDVRVNGVSVLSLTAQNTRATAVTAWTTFSLGMADSIGGSVIAASQSMDFDDLYVADGSGAAPWNTFLGDCRVDAVVPTGVGANAAWTPSTGANWSCVDEMPPNGDTDYTSGTTVGITDSFAHGAAPVVGGTIHGIQHCLNVKKMDAGVCLIAPVVKHGATVYPGTDQAPATSYGYLLQLQQTNPGTGAAWVEADFNAAEFGYRKTA